MITVKEVSTAAELAKFVKFPHCLYDGNPYWVPPIWAAELKTLDPKFNPVFDFAKARYFLALKHDRIVGRIAAMINQQEIDYLGIRKMRFGWFDMIDEMEVSRALLRTVETWAIQEKMTFVEGPVGFTNLDKAGLLVEGFKEIATSVTLYNHSYYSEHLVALGFEKAADWIEFEIKMPTTVPERVARLSKIVSDRSGVSTVPLRSKKELAVATKEILDLFNESYRHLHGFVPINERMKGYYARKFLSFLSTDHVSIVRDSEGRPAAFGVTMPSYAKALQRANGRLYPLGFMHLANAKRRNERAELSIIGVRPDLLNKGIPTLIFKELIDKFIPKNFKWIETNPEYEDNHSVQALWKNYEVRQHKRRRSYKKQV